MPPSLRLAALSAGLAGLLLFGLGLVFQENVRRYWLNPRIPFQVYRPPPAPYYARPDAWAAWRPSEAGAADVFLVGPGLYASPAHWNAPLNDGRARALMDRLVVGQLSRPFAEDNRLFVPHYRQATLYTMWSHAEDSQRARALAGEDVVRAFDVFQAAGGGRPILLVGIGQGGLHVLRLLEERFADEALRARLVVAYVIGQAVPRDLVDGEALHIPLCDAAEATGCLAAWASLEIGMDPFQLRDRSMAWRAGRYRATAGRALVCVNPLTWRGDEATAPEAMNLGARALDFNAAAPGPVRLAASAAQCTDGLLWVERPEDPALRRRAPNISEVNLADIALFYENIRENVKVRIAAYRAGR